MTDCKCKTCTHQTNNYCSEMGDDCDGECGDCHGIGECEHYADKIVDDYRVAVG